jgi:hypothetical protein
MATTEQQILKYLTFNVWRYSTATGTGGVVTLHKYVFLFSGHEFESQRSTRTTHIQRHEQAHGAVCSSCYWNFRCLTTPREASSKLEWRTARHAVFLVQNRGHCYSYPAFHWEKMNKTPPTTKHRARQFHATLQCMRLTDHVTLSSITISLRLQFSWISKKPLTLHGTLASYINYPNCTFCPA